MTPPMRQLGNTGPKTFPIALGCMGMSGMYGHSEEAESIATIHAALEAGINVLDTGDFYGQGHNELLIRKALQGRREQAVLSVKFGAMRGPDGAWLGFDSRPAAVKNFCAFSLQRLGVECIDIYRPARLDPSVPIEETIGAIAQLVKAGYVKHIGLSEVGAETIRRAAAVHPICDLQIEYALITRGPEEKIFPVLQELGIGVTAYGVLSRGLLAGSKASGPTDMRAHLPRFAASENQKLVEALGALAAQKGVSPSTLAIAWALQKGEHIIPTIGARKRSQLTEALAAVTLSLTPAEVQQLETAVPASAVKGTRYGAPQMRGLDSER
jgi:aryl-alcohol dehydrogenase-like predicted oxidoreductase